MGGVDKGLQEFDGTPLALHALRRLAPQVGRTLVNANRHLDRYREFGVPVCPDALPDFAGPLAGFLAGLAQCETPYLLTVPCDTPLFPADLAMRLADGLLRAEADLAIASAPETGDDGTVALRPQPVFCLMRTQLRPSLQHYVDGGGRKVRAWAESHKTALVPFDREGDAAGAFLNANTLAELHALSLQRATH